MKTEDRKTLYCAAHNTHFEAGYSFLHKGKRHHVYVEWYQEYDSEMDYKKIELEYEKARHLMQEFRKNNP